MRKLNSKGFGVVEVLLLIVTVAVIGGIGYYAWHKQDEKNKLNKVASFAECKASTGSKLQETYPEVCVTKNGKSYTNTDQKVTTEPKTVLDETASWLLYSPPGGEYKIRLADGWDFNRYLKTPEIDAYDLSIKTGTKAKVTEVEGGKDFVTGLIINFDTQKQVDSRYTKQTSLTTKGGLEVEKYYYLETKDVEGLGTAKGGKEYLYIIKAPKGYFRAYYVFAPEQTDYHENIEKIVKTVEF